jgi:hypothetical protein
MINLSKYDDPKRLFKPDKERVTLTVNAKLYKQRDCSASDRPAFKRATPAIDNPSRVSRAYEQSQSVASNKVKDRWVLVTSQRIMFYGLTDVKFEVADIDYEYTDLSGTPLSLDQLALTVALLTFDIDNFTIIGFQGPLVHFSKKSDPDTRCLLFYDQVEASIFVNTVLSLNSRRRRMVFSSLPRT